MLRMKKKEKWISLLVVLAILISSGCSSKSKEANSKSKEKPQAKVDGFVVNTSLLKNPSAARGGPEISIIYIGCIPERSSKAVYCPRF